MPEPGQDESQLLIHRHQPTAEPAILGFDSEMGTVYTAGHSSHSIELFMELLTKHAIQVLVDVRSAPYSRYAPQFDHDLLPRSLNQKGIRYLFLGRELGGRPDKPEYYDADGHVLYSRITADPLF